MKTTKERKPVRIITTPVYNFDDLDDNAKEKARDWFREATASDNDFAVFINEDAKTVFGYCGFKIEDISWSGFWSQGDGASFTGSWTASDVNAKKLREYAPKDKELHRIADICENIAERNPEASASISRNSHQYSHKFTVSLDADDMNGSDEDDLQEAARDAMDWIYRTLEKEYEYQNADAQIDDTIRANEYTFTAEGEREGYVLRTYKVCFASEL